MKKKAIIIVAIVLAAILVLSAIGFILYQNLKPSFLGDISQAEITLQSSERHSDADILNAVRLVKKHFMLYFGGCTLDKLYYDDEMSLQEEDYVKSEYDVAEAIVLYSEFHTGDAREDSGLNANSEYDHWNWVVVKSKDGEWKLETWGHP